MFFISYVSFRDGNELAWDGDSAIWWTFSFWMVSSRDPNLEVVGDLGLGNKICIMVTLNDLADWQVV